MCLGKIEFDILLITKTERVVYRLPETVNVIELNRSNKYSFKSAFKLYSILKDYQMVHIHMRHTYKYLALVKKITNLKVKFIFHDHLGINLNKKLPFKWALYFKPDVYIAVSDESCKWARDNWKIDAMNIYLFSNLPKLSFIELHKNNLLTVKRELKLNLPEIRFVCVGNIKMGKNQLFAVQLAECLGFKLDIIGMNQDKDYYDKISVKLTNDIDLIENCFETSEILKDYDFALMVSQNESGPLVLMEYLLAGIPFIAYKTGGISEILANYFPQFFLENLDFSNWERTVNLFIDERPTVDRSIVDLILKKHFNRSIYFSRLNKIYNGEFV